MNCVFISLLKFSLSARRNLNILSNIVHFTLSNYYNGKFFGECIICTHVSFSPGMLAINDSLKYVAKYRSKQRRMMTIKTLRRMTTVKTSISDGTYSCIRVRMQFAVFFGFFDYWYITNTY